MKINCPILLLFCVAIFCLGCKKDQQPISPQNADTVAVETKLDTTITLMPITASIIGKWKIQKQRVQTLTDSTGKITDVTKTTAATDTTSYYQFNADSTAIFITYTFFASTYTLQDGATVISANKPFIFLYKILNSTLSIGYKYGIPLPLNANPGPYEETIVQLNSTTLVLHAKSTVEYNSPTTTFSDTYLTRE